LDPNKPTAALQAQISVLSFFDEALQRNQVAALHTLGYLYDGIFDRISLQVWGCQNIYALLIFKI
jgi:hypothetical protein